MIKIHPDTRADAIELLLCAADIKITAQPAPAEAESGDFEFPVLAACERLGIGVTSIVADLAWATRERVRAPALRAWRKLSLAEQRACPPPLLNDLDIILEAARWLGHR